MRLKTILVQGFLAIFLAVPATGVDRKSKSASPTKKSPSSKPAAAKSQPAREPQQDPLSQLLLSSAWCSFSYNKVSGASHQKRVKFSSDGTWSDTSRAETYSSGDYGSVAGQNDAENGGRWRVENNQLYLSEGYGELQPVEIMVKRNSNGYPIIVADGVEYSQCN